MQNIADNRKSANSGSPNSHARRFAAGAPAHADAEVRLQNHRCYDKLIKPLNAVMSRIEGTSGSISTIFEVINTNRDPQRLSMRSVILTVLHGTFEPKADWTLEGSPFRKAIKKGVAGLVIRRCEWSGKNTFDARRRGELDLEAHISNIEKDFPGLPHFLIGHSHGGSVIAYGSKRTRATVNE